MNIASGSTGNATYIGTENTHILIDCGISKKRLHDALAALGLTLKDMDAVLISHEHIDHTATLGVVERAAGLPVYATAGTIRAIKNMAGLGHYDTGLMNVIKADEAFTIGDIRIRPFTTWHDAAEPVCYRFESGHRSAAIVTDLGDYGDYLTSALQGLDMLMLEANHDIRMLETGPYPYPLQMRIKSQYGHLSNEASGRFLDRLLHDNIGHIMLAHISRENNTRELAQMAVEAEIAMSESIYGPKDFDIKTARHDMPTDIMEV